MGGGENSQQERWTLWTIVRKRWFLCLPLIYFSSQWLISWLGAWVDAQANEGNEGIVRVHLELSLIAHLICIAVCVFPSVLLVRMVLNSRAGVWIRH